MCIRDRLCIACLVCGTESLQHLRCRVSKYAYTYRVDTHTVRMPHNLDDLGLSTRPDLAVESFEKVDDSTNQFPPPALVANAVAPEVLSSKRRFRLDAIAYETSSGMRVHGQQERDEKVVSIPERFVALLPYLRVCCGEHEQHAQHHNMPRDTTGLHVMDLNCGFSTYERTLDVEEIDVMCCYMHYRPEEHGIGHLTVKPFAFVQR